MSARYNAQNNYCTFCRGILSVGPFCPTCGAQVPCPYFLKGYCRDGDECPFAHIHSERKKKTRSPGSAGGGRGRGRSGRGRGRGRGRGGRGRGRGRSSSERGHDRGRERSSGHYDYRGPPGSHVYSDRDRYHSHGEHPHDEYYEDHGHHVHGYHERKVPCPKWEPMPKPFRDGGKEKKRREKRGKKKSHPKSHSRKSSSPSSSPSSSSSSPVSKNNDRPPRECREVGCSLYKKAIANAQEGQKCRGKIKDTGKKCKKVLKKCSLVDDIAGIFGKVFR